MAFPLLRKLADCDDALTKKVFKEELAKRIESGYSPVVMYLIKEKYLSYLNTEELSNVFPVLLTAVENIPDFRSKRDLFSILLSMIEGTDLMDKFSSEIETILSELLTMIVNMPDSQELEKIHNETAKLELSIGILEAHLKKYSQRIDPKTYNYIKNQSYKQELQILIEELNYS